MDFGEFWSMLPGCLKEQKVLETRKRRKRFKAVMAGSRAVTVVPESTGEPRNIEKGEFRKIWNIMKDDARGKRCVSTKGRYRRFFNPAYVCVLIDYKVGDRRMRE